MTTQEIETLAVRMTGEMKPYIDELTKASAATTKVAEEIKQELGTVEKAVKNLGGLAGNVASTVGGYIAAVGATGWLKGALNAYIGAEGGALRLKAAIEANGRAAAPVMAEYTRFAVEMAEVTTVTKGAALGMLQQAESLGLTDDAAKRAVKNAIALAAAKGGEAEGYLRVSAAVESGNTEMLGRFLPTLRSIKDDGERAAKAQELLGNMFQVAKAEGASLGGQIAKLDKEYAGLTKQFGSVVAEFVAPVTQGMRWVVSLFQGLSKEMKTGIVVVVGLAAAAVTSFTLITGAIAIAGVVFNSAFGGVGILVGLIVTGLGLVAGSIAGAVVSFGGITAVMDVVKQKAEEAWAWLKPVRQAITSFFTALWQVAVDAWTVVKDFAVETWDSITASFTVNWDDIRETMRDVFIFGEFALKNFGQVAEFVWAGLKLGFIVAADTVIHFFLNQLPVLATWFLKAFTEMTNQPGKMLAKMLDNEGDLLREFLKFLLDGFKTTMNSINTMWTRLAKNIFELVKNLPALVKGTIKFENIWQSLTEGLGEEFAKLNLNDKVKEIFTDIKLPEMPKLPERIAGPLEQRWRIEFEALRDKMGIDFAKFREMKLLEWAKENPAIAEAAKMGKEIGKAMGTGAIEGVKDAAAYGSAEATARAATYRAAIQSSGESAAKRQEKLLMEIRDAVKKQAEKPGVPVVPAELKK